MALPLGLTYPSLVVFAGAAVAGLLSQNLYHRANAEFENALNEVNRLRDAKDQFNLSFQRWKAREVAIEYQRLFPEGVFVKRSGQLGWVAHTLTVLAVLLVWCGLWIRASHLVTG